MAQKIELTSGSILCGSPVIVSVTADSPGKNATFHRSKLVVKAALSTNPDYEDYLLSWPASDGEVMEFDISSVLRSELKEHAYSALTTDTAMPYIKYTLQAYDEWMIDGIVYDKQNVRDYGGYLYSLGGLFTEVERSLAGKTKQLTKYSRKPATGEVCNLNDLYLSAAPPSAPLDIFTQLTAGPTVSASTLSAVGPTQIHGRTVYVEDNPDRRLFQFVNGLGVIETASCITLESLSYNFTKERNVLNSYRSFKPSATRRMTRFSARQVYEFSTGPVTREWADWWCNEFLCAPESWVLMQGVWTPCTVEADDELKVYDRTKGDLIELTFTMQPDFSGGFSNRV